MAHQNGVSHAPMPALPKLPLQRQDMAVLMVVETLAEADSPAAVGERLLQSLQVLIADAAGGVLLQAGHGTATPLAAVGTAPALAARLAEALPARASALHCLSLDELDIDSSLRKALEAEGCRALLLLPLTVAGSCAGVALMLLPKAYRLAPTQKRVLTTAAAVAAQALTAALRQQALAARPTPGPAMPRRREPSGRTVDAVTGLTSGHQFRALLDMEVERARRYHESLSLLLIDIDAFRAFNDRYGHAEGDRALARLGEILRQELRKVDNACRYGGEEFAVLLPRCGAGAVERLAERLRRRIAAEVFTIAGQRAPLTVSIGAAVYPPGSPVERFIRSVDDALCRAKAGGRNRVVLA